MQNRDLNWKPWHQIARLCPIECEVSHLTEEDYVDTVDEKGIPCKRAKHHFVEGTMTATEEAYHWRFDHPGFKGGSFRIHALICDETPGYRGVTFQ